jgi:hypothetical protein
VSARAKRPSTKPPTRAKSVTQKGRPSQVDEDAATNIYDSGNFGREAPSPIKAISMKTPGQQKIAADGYRAVPEVKKPMLRPMSEVHARPKQQSLGYLAPPRDAKEVRARRVQDYIVWGSISIIVASAVALAIWFLGR